MTDYDESTGWPIVETITNLAWTDGEVRKAVEMANPAELQEAHRRLAERAGAAVFEKAEAERRLGVLVQEHPALKSAPRKIEP